MPSLFLGIQSFLAKVRGIKPKPVAMTGNVTLGGVEPHMKKFLSLLMIVTVMSAFLAGCSGGSGDAAATGGEKPAAESEKK